MLNLHRSAATRRIQQSWELTHNYPATLGALADGDLTERAAFTIVEELAVLEDPAHIRAAEAAILEWARQHPLHRIKQIARREAARRDPTVNDRRHKRALRDRQIRMITNDDATADLIISHNAADTAAAMTSLTKAAIRARRQGDTRTLDQLRADIAIHRLTHHGGNTGNAGGAQAGNGNSRGGTDSDMRGTGTDGSGSSSSASGESGKARDNRGSTPAGGDCTSPGARTEVVIHATAEEIRAVLTDTAGTGGEIDSHGPLPQSVLRQALLNALADKLREPDDPTPPDSGPPDSGPPDSGPPDSGPPDSGPPRQGPPGEGPSGRGPRNPPRGPRTGPRPEPDTSDADAGATDRGTTPAAGHARLSPEQVRRAAAAYVTAPPGAIHLQLIDQPPPSNPRRYTPSDALAHYIRRRDRTCRFPGCNRPAIYTDIDHRHPFEAGGETTADNLHCLCRHHHRLKHRGNWAVHRNPDNSDTWTSPTGRRYRTEPSHR